MDLGRKKKIKDLVSFYIFWNGFFASVLDLGGSFVALVGFIDVFFEFGLTFLGGFGGFGAFLLQI